MKKIQTIFPLFVAALFMISCNVTERDTATESQPALANNTPPKTFASPATIAAFLKKAIAAQNLHNSELLAIQGVTGTGVGVDSTKNPTVVILVEKAGIGGIPQQLEGIPVKVIVSGRIEAFPGAMGVGMSAPIAKDAASVLLPPSDLSYASNPALYIAETPIDDNAPSITGTVTSWTISPALPSGLKFNTNTGVISGTPKASAGMTNYTVTAGNKAGSTSTVINITVNALQSPSNLSYPSNPAVYTLKMSIDDNTPSDTGMVSSWSISPALPSGLKFNTGTGIISGTPTKVSAATNYTITARNSAGTTSVTVNITVNATLQPPFNLSYSQNPAVYTAGEAIPDNAASVTGTVTSFSINPALPAGLTFNTGTGVISGAPAFPTAAANYTVTAANGAGATSTMVNITAKAALQPPSDLSYSENPATYTAGITITDNAPSVTGTVTSFSITPVLPEGLTFNTATGVISGTPAFPTAAANYAVTAGNDAGATLTTVSILVNALPIPVCDIIDPVSRFARPVPIGISTGHILITAGTLGARVKNSSGQVFALSNNHIFAADNVGLINDDVLQPGRYDGGADPGDAIGRLAGFEPIMFCDTSGVCPANVIDAAIASTSPDQVGNSTPCDGYGTPSATTVSAFAGMEVRKYGRSTGLTSGTIAAVNVSLKVIYGSGQTALFTHQIYINTAGFCEGGDSGSLIVTSDGNHPVALLFAGSGSATVGNPVDSVLTHLGVTIDGI